MSNPEQTALATRQPTELTVDQLVAQASLVHDAMGRAMRKDEHYGVIPGTGKPSLLKPGAEKLGFLFRLAPRYEISMSNMERGHREYRVICSLHHMPTENYSGAGVGSCSTMETKYRYRTSHESTGRPVPPAYWNERDASLLGGSQFSAKKIDKSWMICRKGQRVEYDNPADYYNTALKMAKKRAHVDAILTATAASDCFTQDVEEKQRPAAGRPAPQRREEPAQPASDPVQPGNGDGDRLTGWYPKSLTDGNWGAAHDDPSSLPSKLVGQEIMVTAKSGKSWPCIIKEVVDWGDTLITVTTEKRQGR